MLKDKPLSQLLAEVEPRLTAQQNIMVDRQSYDKLKTIAVETAKALEFYAMTNDTFPEYGDVARQTLTKFKAFMGDGE